jgi:hypothetical protein
MPSKSWKGTVKEPDLSDIPCHFSSSSVLLWTSFPVLDVVCLAAGHVNIHELHILICFLEQNKPIQNDIQEAQDLFTVQLIFSLQESTQPPM